MIIKNTMCKLNELSQWEIDSLVDNMPNSHYFDFSGDEFIGVNPYNSWGTWDGRFYTPTIVTYTEMMQLLGKTMQFTKSDLKTGVHFVKDREGTFAAVFKNVFCGNDGFVRLSSFNDELENANGNNEMDIVEVYETDKDRSMTSYLKGLGLRRVWERTEKTPAQKEMEVLQVKMMESQAKMNELQAQMKVVQAKL
jgi:hypothetical protein